MGRLIPFSLMVVAVISGMLSDPHPPHSLIELPDPYLDLSDQVPEPSEDLVLAAGHHVQDLPAALSAGAVAQPS